MEGAEPLSPRHRGGLDGSWRRNAGGFPGEEMLGPSRPVSASAFPPGFHLSLFPFLSALTVFRLPAAKVPRRAATVTLTALADIAMVAVVT